jgi:hypothetical protein
MWGRPHISFPGELNDLIGGSNAPSILTTLSSRFGAREGRAESKWELDSRNVRYGIFSATPKKRAK